MIEGTLFVDANILIYSALPDSEFYFIARDKISRFIEDGVIICISGQILREYLAGMTRILLNKRSYDAQRLQNDVLEFERQYEVYEETRQTRHNLLQLLLTITTGGKQVHDANIVATMQQYGVRKLLTNNVDDFRRFDKLIEIVPLLEKSQSQQI